MAWKDRLPGWAQRAIRTTYPLQRSLALWSEAGGMRMSAAMSFYGILSLAPLLLAIVAMLGWWMDRSVLEERLLGQMGAVIGAQGAGVLQAALESAQEPKEGLTASVIGFVVLLFGATGVFGELQQAFERVWSHGRAPLPKSQGFWRTASLRLRGIGYILVFGFLLLVSLMVSTLLALFSGWATRWMPLEMAFRVLNELAAFFVCAGLFLGLMRLSGGPKPRTRFLLVGAVVGAILFTLGRQFMAMYLSTTATVSAYGAAGSLIVLLMWIYFSSAVLLLGAGCARALEEYADERKAQTATNEAAASVAAPAPVPAPPRSPAPAAAAGPGGSPPRATT
jgi:membrane protein